MMRAVVYCRYSSDAQRDTSIADQLRLCQEFVGRQGWELVQVYRDAALSGATTLRPGYQALLEGARLVAFDVVVAEALDRLSRDQEDVAGLFKRLRFSSIRLVTVAEGEISELHVGLKGTMNALFLRDLAQKTHRGLRGRAEAGHSAGGNAYGYKVVQRLSSDGQPVAGERQIDVAQAAVVARIFRAYAAGDSPKRIAHRLNADGVAGPRGGAWSASSINGNRARGTGILNNELYVGRLVWNRLAYVKDPETGRRRSRTRGTQEVVITEVPDLRIVEQPLWDAVKARQSALDVSRQPEEPASPRTGFWTRQRPRYLFSGLMRCGVCGGGFSKISAAHFGCSTARNKGETICTNLLTIRRDVLENTVLDALRTRLTDPALFKAFADAFVEEWNKLQGSLAAEHAAQRGELDRVRRQVERLVDALADGTPAAMVRDRMIALDARRLQLEAAVAAPPPAAPRIHPNLAEVYRSKVATLAQALTADDAAEARELVRGLVEAIVLAPDDGKLAVTVRGALASILQLAAGAKHVGARGDITDTFVLCEQIKMVAGAGFEPAAFRL